MSTNKVSAKTKKKVTKGKVNKKRIGILVLLLCATLAILISAYIGIRYIVITLKYKEYKEKMDGYYLSELYINEKSNSIENVQNNELIKVIIGSVKNTKDINKIYTTSNEANGLDKWYEYSTRFNINKSVENNDKKANKIDAAIVLANAVSTFLDENVIETNLEMSENKLAKYTADEKKSIAKAVTLGLIENKDSEINNTKLLKGMLNKMIVTIVEKYSTIYYGTNKQDVNLVTDIEKMPENYKEYPYIIDNIEKEIYELDFQIQTNETAQNPKRAYEIMGDLYMQIDNLVENYFDGILNVNYETITEESFLNSISQYTVYKTYVEDVQDYVKYVKDNNIKIEGKATPLLPIIYNNGEQYIVRTKVELNILNSNTNKNILFGDEEYNVSYNGKNIVVYIDVPMGMTFNGYSLRVHTSCMARFLAKQSSQIVLEK